MLSFRTVIQVLEPDETGLILQLDGRLSDDYRHLIANADDYGGDEPRPPPRDLRCDGLACVGRVLDCTKLAAAKRATAARGSGGL